MKNPKEHYHVPMDILFRCNTTSQNRKSYKVQICDSNDRRRETFKMRCASAFARREHRLSRLLPSETIRGLRRLCSFQLAVEEKRNFFLRTSSPFFLHNHPILRFVRDGVVSKKRKLLTTERFFEANDGGHSESPID